MATEAKAARPGQIAVPGFEIGPDDVVVDVGCGDGAVCSYAGRRGAEVIGIDIDPDYLALADDAMRWVPARSWRGLLSDCDPIPLPDGHASVVVCTEVLEHVAAPGRLVAELARIGRPGARYLVSVPDPASEAIMRLVAPEWYWEPPYHRRVFEHARLEAMLADAGLGIESRASSGAYWSLWWAFRMTVGDARPYAPTPHAPLLEHWEATWEALAESPGGARIAGALDRLIPKSQILVARKPDACPTTSRAGGSARLRSRLRRRLRDGLVRLGGYELRWAVRRAAG